MAFTATVEWEVRSTGSDTNGGGFDTASAGTDYSQQDSAQYGYTDLVIDGSVNTKITSVARPFTSADVGNIINVTGGTGFTVQRVQISSVAASAATCDKAVGTVGSTGGTGNLGGGLATPAAAAALVVSGNTIWIQSGTYTLGSTVNLGVTVCRVRGYQTAHGDRTGTRPTVTSSTNSVNLFTRNSVLTTHLLFDNLSLTHSAATRGVAIYNGSTGTTLIDVAHCVIDGALAGVSGLQAISNLVMVNTEVKNCTTSAVTSIPDVCLVVDCYFHDNAQAAIATSSKDVTVIRSLIVENTGGGMSLSNTSARIRLVGCTVANNGSHGVSSSTTSRGTRVLLESNIFYGNTGYGVSFASGSYDQIDPSFITNNAFGGNSSGATQNYTTGTGAVTLTADPFTDSSNADYSLNATAGGGTACKGAGYSVANILP